MALPCSADAAARIADHALIGDALVAARPGPARRRIEDQRAHRVAVRRRLQLARCARGAPARAPAPASPRSRPCRHGFPALPHPATGLIIAPRCSAPRLRPKSPRKLAPERLQDAAIAAVAVDDQEIARRQRAGDLAAEIAQICRHAGDRERQRARRPVVLARQPDRNRRQPPEIVGLAPALDDAAR